MAFPAAAQRRSAASGPATFAVMVTDPSGTPITDVQVTMTGPAQRSGATEGGRIAFEELPIGSYHFTFTRGGYEPTEQDAVGRRGAAVDVKVTMTPKLKSVPSLAVPSMTAGSPAPRSDARAVVLDMPAFIEKNYVGRAEGKTTPMACSAGAASTLVQINDPIAQHAHSHADEFIYVIAGEGTARLDAREEALGAGVFMMIPRGTSHAFVPGRKKPLVFVSTLAGEGCP